MTTINLDVRSPYRAVFDFYADEKLYVVEIQTEIGPKSLLNESRKTWLEICEIEKPSNRTHYKLVENIVCYTNCLRETIEKLLLKHGGISSGTNIKLVGKMKVGLIKFGGHDESTCS